MPRKITVPDTYQYVPASYYGKGDKDDDYRNHILFTIIKRRYKLHEKTPESWVRRQRKEGGWVELPLENFLSVIPTTKYKAIKQELIDEGVIEVQMRDGKPVYSAWDHISMAYRLNPAYRDQPHKRVRVKKLGTAVKLWKRRNFRSFEREGHQIAHLRAWLDRVEVDYDGALAYLNAAQPDDVDDVEEWRKGQVLLLDMIRDKQCYLISDDYGRVHTPITSLLTELRPFLSFQGIDGRLVSIDVKNSQVTFLLHLVRQAATTACPHLAIGPSLRTSVCTGTHSSNPSVQGNTQAAEPNAQSDAKSLPRGGEDSLQPYSVFTSVPKDELEKFEADVLTGQIYDRLMADVGITDRAKFKPAFFANVLYGDTLNPRYGADSKIRQAFIMRYPHVWEFIQEAKRATADEIAAMAKEKAEREAAKTARKAGEKLVMPSYSKRTKPFAKLARQMQRAESDLMIGKVVGDMASNRPYMPVLTVHDSIISIERYETDLKTYVERDFLKYIGVVPTLKVQNLHRDAA